MSRPHTSRAGSGRLNSRSAARRSGDGHCPGSPSRLADQSKEPEERADCPESIMAACNNIIETKRTKCYTKSGRGCGQECGRGWWEQAKKSPLRERAESILGGE